MRNLKIAVLSIAMMAVPLQGIANHPFTHHACSDVTASVSVFKQVGTDVLENLAFDGLGRMWVSNSTKSRIEGYDNTGALLATIAVAAPGAITPGPDGKIYVNVGAGAAGSLARSGQAGVVRFDPASFFLTIDPVAAGWNMANGATFDSAGFLYTSNDFDKEVVRVDVVNKTWTKWADVYGTNGLVHVPSASGGDIYAAVTFDQRSPIERIPVANPGSHSTFSELSLGGASIEPGVRTPSHTDPMPPLIGLKGLDDMTSKGGYLYVVANGMGELLRVSLADGTACLVASGLQNPSSVRFENGFDSSGDIFVTEFSGAIRRVAIQAG